MDELAAPGGSVGHRLARQRGLCGLSRRQLADRAEIDADLIAGVEQGLVPASAAFTATVARALNVDVDALYGQPYGFPSSTPRAEHAGIAALRAALDCPEDSEPVSAPMPAGRLRASLDECDQDRSRADYPRMLTVLPDLLAHAALATTHPGHDGQRGWALLADACVLAQDVAYRLGYLDLAALANHGARDAARRCGDPLRVAVTAGGRAALRLYRGDYFGVLLLTDRAHTHLADQTDPAADAVRVALHLREAITYARIGNADRAEEHLASARGLIARGIPPSPRYTVLATEANLDIHTVAVPVELGDATTALARAERIKLPTGEEPERLGRYGIDLARAWTLHGDHPQALHALHQARRAAPQLVRLHPQARETVHLLAEHDRRATDSLAGFARWLGITL